MSVVNQMLQELDRRRASSGERGSLPQHLHVLPRPVRVWPRRTLLLSAAMLATFLAIGGGYAWEQIRYAKRSSVAATAALPAAFEKLAAASSPTTPPRAAAVNTEFPRRPAQPVVAQDARPAPNRAGASSEANAAASTTAPGPASPSASANDRRGAVTSTPSEAAAGKASRAAKRLPAASSRKPESQAAKRERRVATDAPVEKNVLAPSARERADDAYRRARTAQAEGGAMEALPLLQQALRDDAGHIPARIALARLLAEGGGAQEAAELLCDGAVSGAGNAEYRGLHAALLQRLHREGEAVTEYQAALRLMPGNAVWWMGLGLSLESLGRRGDARLAFEQAKAAGNLSGELAAFVDQKLSRLP